MAYYKDLREHINALEANNKLVRIKREINKDTEAMPLVRCQFRGLPEAQRKAFLFENTVDAKGKKYAVPLLVASHAPSREVYAMGMMCKPEDIMEKWAQAQRHPIEPTIVETGPVHEEVHVGDSLQQHGGLAEFPIPISTPGFDNAPYFTAANWVTKDPETAIRNVGNYRAMVKSQTRTGAFSSPNQHLRTHWEKCQARGIPLQAAMVLGAAPNIGFVATAKLPYEVDEYAVAGGISGEPVALVRCKTVDIEVPATAEIVIEGEIPTDYLEREAPFGEFTGYMGLETISPYFNVTCITHRKNCIYNAFISQFTPSESSKLKQVANEGRLYKFLKDDCSIPGILDVAIHEESGTSSFTVIKIKKTDSTQSGKVLEAAFSLFPTSGKITVVVDEDIDPRDLDSVIWAWVWRVQAYRDIKIVDGRMMELDPSLAPTQNARPWNWSERSSALLVDATRKWDYPTVSLPRKDIMERARKIWEEEGLPPLSLKTPWHGYSLGFWTKENEEEAELALKGEYYQTGERLAKQRVKLS